MDFQAMSSGLSSFFQKLFTSMSEVMEWLLTPVDLLEWHIAPVYLLTGSFIIAGVVFVIIR